MKTIRLNRITIPQLFTENKPSKKKIEAKRKLLLENNAIFPHIVLDRNNNCVDGYIWYLLAKEYGFRKISYSYLQEKNNTKNVNLVKNLYLRLKNYCKYNGYTYNDVGFAFKIMKSEKEIFYIYKNDIEKVAVDMSFKIELYHESYKRTKKYSQTPLHLQCTMDFDNTLKYIKKHRNRII